VGIRVVVVLDIQENREKEKAGGCEGGKERDSSAVCLAPVVEREAVGERKIGCVAGAPIWSFCSVL